MGTTIDTDALARALGAASDAAYDAADALPWGAREASSRYLAAHAVLREAAGLAREAGDLLAEGARLAAREAACEHESVALLAGADERPRLYCDACGIVLDGEDDGYEEEYDELACHACRGTGDDPRGGPDPCDACGGSGTDASRRPPPGLEDLDDLAPDDGPEV